LSALGKGDVLVLEGIIHIISGIFYGIQIWSIPLLVNYLERFVCQKGFDSLGGMAWCPILEEVRVTCGSS
jgi:hypothetical protein